MSAPDNELIAEVILYSEGYKHARLLGRKLVSLFSFARDMLSPQQHYDWGLRALKTVLRGSAQSTRVLFNRSHSVSSLSILKALEIY